MPELSPEAIHAIIAIDHLNSWVRSKAFASQSYSLKRFIYVMKSKAIKLLHEDCPGVQHLKLSVPAACRRCSGSGIWKSLYDDRTGKCRACSGSGRVVLEFIETIATVSSHAIDWHTPRNDWHKTSIPLPDQMAVHPVTWKPNTSGKDLELEEAVGFINVAEAYSKIESYKHWVNYDWRFDDGAYVGDAKYHLNVGRAEEGVCSICKRADKAGIFCHRTHGFIESSQWVCDLCQAAYPTSTTIRFGETDKRDNYFDKIPPPYALMDTPNIRQWIERRARQKAVA